MVSSGDEALDVRTISEVLNDTRRHRASIVLLSLTRVQLLARSSRVKEDLMKVQDCGEGTLDINVIVREFHLMDPALEFRCIVTAKKVTAISQVLAR